MPQTTGGISAVNVDFEFSSNGTAWTDLAGATTSIEGVEQERISGEAYTFDGDMAIIGKGKRAPMEVTINFIYTETSNEPFEVIRAAFEAENGTDLFFRWAPRGKGATGRFVFTTINGAGAAAAVPITNFVYHELNAEEGAPVVGSFTFRAPGIAKTNTANSTGLGS